MFLTGTDKTMYLTLRLCCFVYLTSILFVNSFVNCVSHSEGASQNNEPCYNRNLIIISTVDGTVTALDTNTGQKCWSVILDSEKFISSSLSELEMYENGRRIFLVPSLDGGLYKYDNFRRVIQPLPVNVDSLISHTEYMDSSTSVIGGKIKIIHGIHRLTGEIIYTCKINECNSFKIPFPDNILVIEEIIQCVNAIDSSKAEKKWHFRVVELKIKLASQVFNDNSSAFHNTKQVNALIPHNFNDFADLDVYKISLQSGFAGMLNKTTQDFTWLFKVSSPINDAWYLKDNAIKVLDPFDKESGFFTVDMDDGKHSALLFLGTYQNQMFIKRSKKIHKRNMNLNSLSKNVLYQPYLSPVCPKSQNLISVLHSETSGTDLMLNSMDFNVSDHGLYFYMNFSIAENLTHCIITAHYIEHYDSTTPIKYWLSLFIMFCCLVILITYTMVKKKKDSLNALPSKTDPNLEFTSRFYQDFEMISVLGKGGFGVVMDVKNKIDDCRYAVKRICLHEEFNNTQYERVLREVKALAKLDHHGIVRYFNAWIEYPPMGWQEKKDIESNICDITKSSYSETAEKTSFSISKMLENSKVSPKHDLLGKLNQNPFQPFNNDSFSEDVLNKDCKFSDYSSSSESDSSFNSKEHSSSYTHSKRIKQVLSKSSDDSDSFIQFENNISSCNTMSSYKNSNKESSGDDNDSDLLIMFEKSEMNDSDSFIQFENNISSSSTMSSHKNSDEESSDDDTDSDLLIMFDKSEMSSQTIFSNDGSSDGTSVAFEHSNEYSIESCNEKENLIPFSETTYSKKNLSYIGKDINFLVTPKRHVKCCETLKSLNKSLICQLDSENFQIFCRYIFHDVITSKKSITENTNWTEYISVFTQEKLAFYQKWLICILCNIQSSKDFTCNIAIMNLYYILFDIDKRLNYNNLKNGHVLDKQCDRSSKISVNFSLNKKIGKNELISSSKQKYEKHNMDAPVSNEESAKEFPRGYLYIQMQLCQKESLRDWLNRNSDHREYNKVMEIFSEIVDAVHYVHNCGLMHRDLKPSNIYFSMEGAIKIGDFGLATSSEIQVENVINNQPLSDIHTSDIGTEFYMSPEQKLKQDYDCKTDIYSLGIILFELLVPFKTYSERCKVLSKVRRFQFPQEFKRNFQNESEFVQLLLDDDPKGRPTTNEIKQHPLLLKYTSTIK